MKFVVPHFLKSFLLDVLVAVKNESNMSCSFNEPIEKCLTRWFRCSCEMLLKFVISRLDCSFRAVSFSVLASFS